jgi:hypothetical protein
VSYSVGQVAGFASVTVTRLDNVVDDASTKAARTGFELLKFDLDHGQVHVEGPVGPGSPEWDIAGAPGRPSGPSTGPGRK